MTVRTSVIMGSASNWEAMKEACQVLEESDVSYEKKIVSVHRTPDLTFEHAQGAREKGVKIIIAGAGGTIHLPGMVAAETTLPIINVLVQSRALNGLDSLLSIIQMSGDVPVTTTAIGKAGIISAGLLMIQVFSMYDLELETKLVERCSMLAKTVIEGNDQFG